MIRHPIFKRVIEKILHSSCRFYKIFTVNIGMNAFTPMICYLEITNYLSANQSLCQGIERMDFITIVK